MAKKKKYPELFVNIHDKMFAKGSKDPTKLPELMIDEAKAILGWREAAKGEKHFLVDENKKKIVLDNNGHNRPFRKGLAKKYIDEQLRKKWSQNGETIAIDWYGDILNGQHRLISFVLAEQIRSKDAKYYNSYGWRGEMTMPCMIAYGLDPKNADTTDGGQKRTLGDVFFRREEMGDRGAELTDKQLVKINNMCGQATRLVWLRSGGKDVSDAPAFPHSEAIDFLKLHPRIKDSVEFVIELGADLGSLVGVGQACGLHYLMSTCKSEDIDEIDFSCDPAANRFWEQVASGEGLEKGTVVHTLRSMLIKMAKGSGQQRDIVLGTIIKAWNIYVEDQEAKASAAKLKVKTGKDDNGKVIILEKPRIGGFDYDVVEEEMVDDEEGDDYTEE